MSTNEKNRFSTLLEELISISGVKNSGLAKALQYDASYISKWVSGRLLPTEKTKKKILSGLSHEIVNQSTSEGLENLYANYQVSFPEELENVIYDNLEIEYDYVTDLQNTCGSLIAPDVSFFAAVVVAVLLAFSTAFFATSCACVASLVASEVVVSSFDAVEASVAVAAATVGIGIMLTLTVKTVNHARIFFIFLIVPPSHELMC